MKLNRRKFSLTVYKEKQKEPSVEGSCGIQRYNYVFMRRKGQQTDTDKSRKCIWIV
jgi:hypothetical protein